MNLESFNEESQHRITDEAADDSMKPEIKKMNAIELKNEEQEMKMSYQNPFKNQQVAEYQREKMTRR